MNVQKWENIEVILDKIRINSTNLSEYHRKRYFYFKDFSKWFRIPIIILSSLSGLFSLSLKPFIQQLYISLIICLISLITTIISSIELYLQIDENAKLEFEQSKQYYILSIDIYKILSLSIENRNDDPNQYLTEKYNEYKKLIEASNLLKRKMKIDLLTEIPEEFLNYENSRTPTPTTIKNNSSIDNFEFLNIKINDDIEEKIESESIYNL